MPTILLKAKDFATEITIFNAKQHKMKTENQISKEHITNNKSVRSSLLSVVLSLKIYPKKILVKLKEDWRVMKKKTLKNPDKLNENENKGS